MTLNLKIGRKMLTFWNCISRATKCQISSTFLSKKLSILKVLFTTIILTKINK